MTEFTSAPATTAAAEPATNGRPINSNRGLRHYAVTELADRPERWARAAVGQLERSNAKLDPMRDLPKVVFSSVEGSKWGMTEAQLTSLRELSLEEIDELTMEAATVREERKRRVRTRAGTPQRRLTETIRLAKDMVSDPPAGIIVDNLLYEKTVTSWVGDGGTYKSFTVLGLACSVAAGRDFSGQLRVPQRYPVLYMCAEHRRHGLIGDIRAWCQDNHADLDELAVYGWDDVVQLGDDSQMDELADFVATHGIKLVVFDTQRKATRGLEENSSTDMGAALANAQKLAYAANAAVVIIHHTTRRADHARGSSVMRDDTDATIIQRAVGEMMAEIVIDKHKSEPAGTTYPISLASVMVTAAPILNADNGIAVPSEAFTTLVARPRDPLTIDERGERARTALGRNEAILVAVVDENNGPPLSPADTHRRAVANGYTASVDTTTRRLRHLASTGCVAEHINNSNTRRTYSSTQPRT